MQCADFRKLLDGTDRAHMAFATASCHDQPGRRDAALAAFPKGVKQRLVAEKLIAPMVQQIFRRGLKGQGGDGYLGGRAHPSVIRGGDIDLAATIRMAQALRADQIPPMVRLVMHLETPPHASIFADGLTEVLFDTPGAIARVWRGSQAACAYELEAVAKDPNGRKLAFH